MLYNNKSVFMDNQGKRDSQLKFSYAVTFFGMLGIIITYIISLFV